MSLLRLAKNCGVLTRILAPTRNASALITTELVSNPAAHNTIRTICHSPIRFCEANGGDENEEDTDPPKRRKYDKPGRDRSKKISVETSIEYLNSSAYRSTYGDNLVWHGYRRVWGGGHFAPPKTRKSCIRFGVVTVASPCPICRDEYLILDHRNLDLLKQFVSPHTGKVISYTKTNICMKQHRNLLVALERAYDYGLLNYEVPFRRYDYSDYYRFKTRDIPDVPEID